MHAEVYEVVFSVRSINVFSWELDALRKRRACAFRSAWYTGDDPQDPSQHVPGRKFLDFNVSPVSSCMMSQTGVAYPSPRNVFVLTPLSFFLRFGVNAGRFHDGERVRHGARDRALRAHSGRWRLGRVFHEGKGVCATKVGVFLSPPRCHMFCLDVGGKAVPWEKGHARDGDTARLLSTIILTPQMLQVQHLR